MRLALATILVVLGLSGCSVRPEPLDIDEISSYVADKRERLTQDQEPVHDAIGLYEAMARALKYNLDHRVELMEAELRQKQLNLAHYSMLPSLVANSAYSGRNNYSGGSSVELLGDRTLGQQSLRSSTSAEREIDNADLTLSWNILDFGLSYVRARQSSDRVLIARENRRKVVNRVVEDVRSAYWRAVTATRLRDRLRVLISRVERALRDTARLATRAQASPLTALNYERELVEIKREIERLDGELSVAKTQLAALMNVAPGEHFEVAIPGQLVEPRDIPMSAESMVATALQTRSELREAAYETRINQREAEVAMLELLPGISADLAPNFNSNEFLFNNHWVTWGAKASWNLLRIFAYPAREAEILARDDLLDARALAITMAIMTQVHVSRVRLIHARRAYATAEHYYDVQNKVLSQIRSALAAGKVSEQTAIREEMNTLVARVKLDIAYVDLQNAFANSFASMGIYPVGEDDAEQLSVAELERALQRSWDQLGDRNF